MINDGYVLLSRKLLDNPIFRDREALQLFLYGLLRANHKPNRIIFNRQEMALDRGQFITGIYELSRATGQTPKQIRNRLALLENAGIWARKRASKFSVITVCNYEYYQNPENYKGQAKGQGEGKQRATDNNDKNENIYDSTEFRLASFLLEEILKNKPDFKKPNLQTWARDIDLMIRKDGRVTDRIREVIVWAQGDSFWRSNILSTGSLRRQFDRLELAMQKISIQGSDRITQYQDLTGRGSA